jgi:hypothetical protein
VDQEELPAPLSGDDDTFDVVDDAIAVLGLRRGVWMGDPRMMIHLVASIIEQAERCLPELVAEARVDDGCGWEDVGRLLGIGAEQAWARFAADSAVADRRWMLDVG